MDVSNGDETQNDTSMPASLPSSKLVRFLFVMSSFCHESSTQSLGNDEMSARDGEEAASDSTLARSSRVEGVTKKTKLHTFALLFVFTHDVSNNSF